MGLLCKGAALAAFSKLDGDFSQFAVGLAFLLAAQRWVLWCSVQGILWCAIN
jgi:hypothetical protein